MEEVLKILNPMSSTIFWSILVFGISIIVLWRFVLKPVNNLISKRQAEIKEKIDNAENQKEEAGKYLEEQKEKLEEAKKEAGRIIGESKSDANKIKEEIEKDARARSKAMLDNTIEEIKREKERSVNDVKNKIVDIDFSVSEKVISKKITEKDHKKIIKESLEELERGID